MTKNSNLYGTKLVEIPAPQFVIFYNGIKEMPDRTVLRLSDAYSVKDEASRIGAGGSDAEH